MPIYVADTLKPVLPNRAVKAHKAYDDWEEMKVEDFAFSLYPNDLVYIEHKSGFKLKVVSKKSTLQNEMYGKNGVFYYCSTNISTGALNLETLDGTYQVESLGVKTLMCLRKGEIDTLGNIRLLEREERKGFSEMKKDRYKKA